MASSQITAVFERVKKWPKKRRQDAAHILLAMERQGTSDISRFNLKTYLQQQWDALAGQKNLKKKILQFNKNIQIPGVRSVRLKGRAARNLDKLIDEGIDEYLAGKTIEAPSISAAVREYRTKHAH